MNRTWAWMLSALLSANAMAVRTDEKAEAVIRDAGLKAFEVKTLTAHIEITETTGKSVQKRAGTVKVKRPNKVRIETDGVRGSTLVFDGRTETSYQNGTNLYVKSPSPIGIAGIGLSFRALPVGFLFDGHLPITLGEAPPAPTYVGTEKIGDEEFDVLEVKSAKPRLAVVRAYFGKDKLLHRTVLTETDGDDKHTFEVTLTDIKLDEPIDDSAWVFVPPKGVQLLNAEVPDLNAKPIAVGVKVPAFSLPTLRGGPVNVPAEAKSHKALLVVFWHNDCEACRDELPRLQKLYKEFRAKGLGIVAVNNGDPGELVNQIATDNGLTFKIALADEGIGPSSVFGKYGVITFPANYLIGSTGKVLFYSAGYDEAGIRAVLKRALAR